MSTSLSFECDPLPERISKDPLERGTFGSLTIRVDKETVTRFRDRRIGEERRRMNVSTFSIVEWIVRNWWALLYEPARRSHLSVPSPSEAAFEWDRRHCLRTAESSFVLPLLFLFGDTNGPVAEWFADEPDALPHGPGPYTAASPGRIPLSAGETEASLSRFVDETLDRVRGVTDDRLESVVARWKAICSADEDERAFCEFAGRMGLDPYDPSDMPEELAVLLEEIAQPENSLACDLSEAARPESIVSQWKWISEVRAELDLSGWSTWNSELPGCQTRVPAQRGYQLARAVRSRLNLAADAVVEDFRAILELGSPGEFRFEPSDPVPGGGLRGLVGRNTGGEFILAGPKPARVESERFLQARAIHHLLVLGGGGPRLVTDAETWHQKSSRAFAAELLAPGAELIRTLENGFAHSQQVEELASRYRVAPKTIEHQIVNHGGTLIDDE